MKTETKCFKVSDTSILPQLAEKGIPYKLNERSTAVSSNLNEMANLYDYMNENTLGTEFGLSKYKDNSYSLTSIDKGVLGNLYENFTQKPENLIWFIHNHDVYEIVGNQWSTDKYSHSAIVNYLTSKGISMIPSFFTVHQFQGNELYEIQAEKPHIKTNIKFNVENLNKIKRQNFFKMYPEKVKYESK